MFLYVAHGKLCSLNKCDDLHDRLETVRRFDRFDRFLITKIVNTTDTAIAAVIVPTKIPASTPLFKPDDITAGNSAKQKEANQ
jgi:hypothetical protein